MSTKLDRLVATRVMKWTLVDRVAAGWGVGPDVYLTGDEANPTYQGFDPSSDISAAWEVIDKLSLSVLNITLPEMHGGGRAWQVRRWVSAVDPCSYNHKDVCVAACVCSLRAVGVPESEITEAMQ